MFMYEAQLGRSLSVCSFDQCFAHALMDRPFNDLFWREKRTKSSKMLPQKPMDNSV